MKFLTKLKPDTAAVLCIFMIGSSFTSLGIAQDAKPKAPNGEIVGRLLDAATGKPVEGATVACEAIINDSGSGGGTSAVTDADGRYRLATPSPGIYNVWLKNLDKDPSKTAVADDGIFVEAGKVAPSQLHLVSSRKVAGRLVDSEGKPLPNLTVSCSSPARPQSGGVQSVKSKADGTFEFSLPPGRAYVYATEQANGNPFDVARSAHALIDVSAIKDVARVTLTMQKSKSTFGDPEWLKRSTPGTQIVRRAGNQGVTGAIVDGKGKPIAGAKVFRYDGPLVPTNDKGEFRIETTQDTQFVMHAFAPGYHVWFGTPTSGDMLKIVLEAKQPPFIAVPDRPDPTPKRAETPPLRDQLVGEWVLVKQIVGGSETPHNGLTMVFTRDALEHIHNRDGMKSSEGSFPYVLDTSKNPSVISFRTTNYEGIVKIEGEVLTICFFGTEPQQQFVSPHGSQVTLLIANRVRK
jgi:uncharacterized protein (TIGR03067 family)